MSCTCFGDQLPTEHCRGASSYPGSTCLQLALLQFTVTVTVAVVRPY